MNKGIYIPNTFMGVPINAETMDRVLSNKDDDKPKTKKPKTRTATISAVIINPQDWILLEGRQHSNYSYGDSFVSMHRLCYSPEVEKAAKELGLRVENTEKEKDGTPYIGNINWEEALGLNLQLGYFTMNIRQGMDLMLDVRNAIKDKKRLYDGKGNKIDGSVLKKFFSEIWGERDPWRGEWLDAKFVDNGGRMAMGTGHELNSKLNLRKNIPVFLMPYLSQLGYADLDSLNHEGLPTKSASKGLYFYPPQDGTVARFLAGSDGAVLGCFRGPGVRDPVLGVRAARKK